MGCYNDLRIKYPGFLLEPPVVDINKLTSVVQGIFPTQVLKFTLGDTIKNHASSSPDTKNENMEEVGLFLPQGKNSDKPTNQNSDPIDTGKFNEHLGKPQIDQSVEEINEGSYQPPENQDHNSRGRPRSPDSECRDRYRYDVTDRRYHFDYYDNRSDSSENYQLTASQ